MLLRGPTLNQDEYNAMLHYPGHSLLNNFVTVKCKKLVVNNDGSMKCSDLERDMHLFTIYGFQESNLLRFFLIFLQ